MSMQSNVEVVNAIVLIKYCNGKWSKKNYFGFPTAQFYDLLSEIVSSDFTEIVVSVYYTPDGHFERAVIEKGGSGIFETVEQLKKWLNAQGG